MPRIDITVLVGLFLLVRPAGAQTEQKLTAADAVPGAQFGQSVALDGAYAVVGAPYDGGLGAAYVYRRDGDAWVEVQKLTALDGRNGDAFGGAVALHGSYLLVGAEGHDLTSSDVVQELPDIIDAGAAYVFELRDGTWTAAQKLTAPSPTSFAFVGDQVALSGEAALIAGYGDSKIGIFGGSAYIFRRAESGWASEGGLVPSTGEPNDFFGWSVALDGNRALVAADSDDDQAQKAGAVYVFDYDGTTWHETAKLTASDGAEEDRFGTSVALDGNLALIGAAESDASGLASGSVYLFQFSNGTWTQLEKLEASDGRAGDRFGSAVALDGDVALVAAPEASDVVASTGAVYVYQSAAGQWRERIRLVPGDADEDDAFGQSVALAGKQILVGAGDEDDKGLSAGAAYAYTVNFLFQPVAAGLPALGESQAAWGDYDGDGDLDLVLMGDSGSGHMTRLFVNNGGTFAPGPNLTGLDRGDLDWGDYDGDGDLDLLVTGRDDASAPATFVYRNDNGTFAAVSGTRLSEVLAGSAAWGDYDNDGDLDLFVSGRAQTLANVSKIFRNDGGGTFTDIQAPLKRLRQGESVWVDYDVDGDLDLFHTGRDDELVRSTILYANEEAGFVNSGFTFVNVDISSVDWGDYDSDGDPDLLLTGADGDTLNTHIYENRVPENGGFVLAQALDGVEYGAADWGDFDNDGDLDVVLAGRLPNNVRLIARIYENMQGSFQDFAARLTPLYHGDVQWGDYDADGDLDLIMIGFGRQNAPLVDLYENTGSTANTRPQPPGGLTGEATDRTVTLSWNAAADAESGSGGLTYAVRIGTASGLGNVAPSHAAPDGRRLIAADGHAGHGRQRSFDELPPGTYFWSVQAVDQGYAGSEFAPEASFTIVDDPPAAPTGFSAADGDQQVTLSWNANSESDLDVYRLERGATAEATQQIAQIPAGTTQFIDTDVSNDGSTFYYRVFALDKAGNVSPSSAVAEATLPDEALPAAPTGVTAVADEANLHVTLTWNAVTDAVSYVVYRGNDPNPTIEVARGLTATLYQDDQVVFDGTTYYYRVRAVDSAENESVFSDNVEVRPGDKEAPAVPEGLVARGRDGDVLLGWDSNDDPDLAGYHIYRGTASEAPAVIDSVVDTVLSYVDSTVVNEITYTYSIAAYDESGNASEPSGSAEATPLPGRPSVEDPSFEPTAPGPEEGVSVRAVVTDPDDNLVNVEIRWTANEVDQDPIALIETEENVYTGQLPAQPGGAQVAFFVFARDVRNNEAMSGSRTYRVRPGRPTLVSPVDRATLQALVPLLYWDAAPGADSYGLQISASQSFVDLVADLNGVPDTSYQVQPDLLDAETQYYWRVNATNEGGTGVWSAIHSFTTEVAQPPLQVSTFEPEIVTARTARLVGSISPAASVKAAYFEVGTTASYGTRVTAAAVEGQDGQFAGTVEGLAAGTGYHYRLVGQATDDVLVAGEDLILTTRPYPASMTVALAFDFQDPSVAASYRLMGLPGQESVPLADVFEGTGAQDGDWMAYRETGTAASSPEGYLEGYAEGEEAFRFTPGNGFWVLSKEAVTYQETADAMPLLPDNTVEIPLDAASETGWQILSNPLDIDVSWSEVQAVNGGVLQAIHAWNGTAHVVSPTFASAGSGAAYYFNNDQGLDTLKIPYVQAPQAANQWEPAPLEAGTIELRAVPGDATSPARVRLGTRMGAEEGLDPLDQYGPPGAFERIHLRIERRTPAGRVVELVEEYRPDDQGARYELVLQSRDPGPVRLAADGLDEHAGRVAVLVDAAGGRTYRLDGDAGVSIPVTDAPVRLALLVGTAYYVEEELESLSPADAVLHGNYPNPFRGSTTIEFGVPRGEHRVRLIIYDVLGREVRRLIDGTRRGGYHSFVWDGRDGQGRALASGMYLYRLEVGDRRLVRTLLRVQ